MLKCLCFFFGFFDPLISFFWILVIDLFFIIFYFIYLFVFLSLLFYWSGLGYIFGCDVISIYLSGLVTAVAVFRNPNTIPFCLTTDLLLNVLFKFNLSCFDLISYGIILLSL